MFRISRCQTYVVPATVAIVPKPPMFRIQNGGTLRNVIIGADASDGIHVLNGGTLENVLWDAGFARAVTVQSPGTVNLSGISNGMTGGDIFLQVDAAATVNLSNCKFKFLDRFVSQSSGSAFGIEVNADRCNLLRVPRTYYSENGLGRVRWSNSLGSENQTTCYGAWASCTFRDVYTSEGW